MYKFEKQDFGLKLTISGDLTEQEISGMTVELKSLVGAIRQPFSIFVDAREVMTLNQSVFHLLSECQRIVKDAGRQSAAIVVNSPILKSQGQRITLDSGSTEAVRFIYSDKTEGWEEVAMDWILNGIEPDPELAVTKL